MSPISSHRITSFLVVSLSGAVLLTVVCVAWLLAGREALALVQAGGLVVSLVVTVLGMLGWRQVAPVPDGGGALLLTPRAVSSVISGRIPDDVVEELAPEAKILRLVLGTLEARGLQVSDRLRERLSRVGDPRELLRLLGRAASVDRAEGLFDGSPPRPPMVALALPLVLALGCGGAGAGAALGRAAPIVACASRVLPAALLGAAKEAAAAPGDWRASIDRWLPTVAGGIEAGLCALEQIAHAQTQGRDHGALVSALRTFPSSQDCEPDQNRRNGCAEVRAETFLEEYRRREPPPAPGAPK